jgi:hypothetical protein
LVLHRRERRRDGPRGDIEAQDILAHLSHPQMAEKLGTCWRDDIEVLNEFVELWR